MNLAVINVSVTKNNIRRFRNTKLKEEALSSFSHILTQQLEQKSRN